MILKDFPLDAGDADGAASAGPVVGNHRPFADFGQLAGHQARQDVGAAAGREGDHELDRLAGPGLRVGGAGEEHRKGGQGGSQVFHRGAHGYSGSRESGKPLR